MTWKRRFLRTRPGPGAGVRRGKLRNHFRTYATKRSLTPPEGIHAKMMKELRTWDLPSYSQVHTDRAFRLLKRIGKLVPPKVCTAIIRTWWDGWTTSARLHEAGGTKCCPWCNTERGDILQHFCRCKDLQCWRSKRLGLEWETEAGPRKEQFFLLGALDNTDGNQIAIRCLALGATYHAFNSIKHWPHRLSNAEAYRALYQSLKEMALDSGKLRSLIDRVWSR